MTVGTVGPADLVVAAREGNRRALGRVLSLVEQGGPEADEIAGLTHPDTGEAHVIGITGAPGTGKSTITGRLTRLLPGLGRRPAVLAVDPSSPLSGGAILGDRVRMDDLAGNGVFIRSVATRGHTGGLALSVPGCVRVFDAVRYDPVIIETVGVGQVETDVVAAADTAVVVVNPGWGDAIQANKAGLLEIADVFVINKADRPGAADARRDLGFMVDLSHVSGQEDESGYRPPIIMTTATDGAGVAEVWDAVVAHRTHLESTGGLARRRAARLHHEVANRVDALVSDSIGRALDDAPLDPARSPASLAGEIAARVLRPEGAERGSPRGRRR